MSAARIVLNTHCDDAAARLGIHGLAARLREREVDATVGDWDNYGSYDVAVFLGYDEDMARARAQNPSIRVALVDPKLSRREWIEAASAADFLMVSSVEQRDAFLRINRNVHIYYMFPVLDPAPKQHRQPDSGRPIVVGYHGNRVHLEAMVEQVRPALEELGRRIPLELHAIYNIAELGRARIGVPDEAIVPVRHIQWTDAFMDDLARCDIGIVPNQLPIRDLQTIREVSAYPEGEFMYEPFDYLMRFKVSSNPGRLYPYALLEIPVVVDFTPSFGQFVLDGVSGFVAGSPHGWLEALDALAASSELRALLGAELRARVTAEYDRQVDRFLGWCEEPPKTAPASFPNVVTPEEELARLTRFRAPGSPRSKLSNILNGAARRIRR